MFLKNWALAIVLFTTACAASPVFTNTPPSLFTRPQPLVPVHIKNHAAWEKAIRFAIEQNHLPQTPENLCAVVAIIEQESNYQVDPKVPNLAGLIEKRLSTYKEQLGPLGETLFNQLLKGKINSRSKSFAQRLRRVKTEGELDSIFRDLLLYYQISFPTLYKTAETVGSLLGYEQLADLNPVTTAGSMQVSVRYALEIAAAENSRSVRQQLYTLQGGVLYGTTRLFGYDVNYSSPLYRFADYNAGFYSSRNAALQQHVATLTKEPLLCDGDLLKYNAQGLPLNTPSHSYLAILKFSERYAPKLSQEQILKDLHYEKQKIFEQTATYQSIKTVYSRLYGSPAYAIVPNVELHSPKFTKKRTTQWFAASAYRRYEECRKRLCL